MITFTDYLYKAERRKDEIARAEQYRLSLQVPKRDPPLMQGLRRLLARLSELLVAWGHQLQARDAIGSIVSLPNAAGLQVLNQSPNREALIMTDGREFDRQAVYHIEVKGNLDQKWSDWFDGLTITPQANDATILTGPVADQAALHGLLAKVRDLGLPLLLVKRLLW